jgi:hypothetical protein
VKVVTRDLDANDLSMLANASLFKAECLSASRVTGRPYSTREERHAEADLFHTAKPVRPAVRMSFFVSPLQREDLKLDAVPPLSVLDEILLHRPRSYRRRCNRMPMHGVRAPSA